MSVLRQFNYLGQMRIDVPHLRSVESSLAGDFDAIIGRGWAGSKPLILRGFTLTGTTVGVAATSLQLVVADSIGINVNASDAGSFLWIPANRAPEQLSSTNGKVVGSFTSNSTNYIGIDFERSADSTTTDTAKFISATQNETSRSVPLGRTLDYKIHINSVPFSTTSTLIPIAKVVTDSNNAIVSVTDARPMLFRLGSGGDVPNSSASYSWPLGRQENTSTTAFSGGDKNILSNKDWMDSVMSRLWELGGGENWYSPTADRNVRLVRYPSPTVFSNGDNFEISTTYLHWKGLRIVFDNANTASVFYNDIADSTTNDASLNSIADGYCWYVDIDRTANKTGPSAVVAKRASLQTLSTPTIPGSRFVFAWATTISGNVRVFTRDTPYYVGATFVAATTSSIGAVRLNETAAHAATPTVLTLTTDNGVKIGYGSYLTTGSAYPLDVQSSVTGVPAINAAGGAVMSCSFAGSNSTLDVSRSASNRPAISATSSGATSRGAIEAVNTGGGAAFAVGTGHLAGAAFDAAGKRIVNMIDAVDGTDGASRNWSESALKQRQVVVNGNFEFWQRGTSKTLNATSTYAIQYASDRWYILGDCNAGGTTTLTMSRQDATAAPVLPYSRYKARLVMDVISGSCDCGIAQEVDRRFVERMRGKKVTLQWKWRRNGFASAMPFSVQVVYGTGAENQVYGGYTGSTTLLDYTGDTDDITSASAWDTVTTTSASTVPTTATTMVVLFSFATSLTGATNYVEFGEVQLCEGTTASPYWDYSTGNRISEIELCRHYYEKSYELDTAPGTNTSNGLHYTTCIALTVANLDPWPLGFHPRFRVPKRAFPIVDLYNTTGTSGQWFVDTNYASAPANISLEGFFVENNTGSSQVLVADFASGHWTADCELGV